MSDVSTVFCSSSTKTGYLTSLVVFQRGTRCAPSLPPKDLLLSKGEDKILSCYKEDEAEGKGENGRKQQEKKGRKRSPRGKRETLKG